LQTRVCSVVIACIDDFLAAIKAVGTDVMASTDLT
jgi:hypothetical protein